MGFGRFIMSISAFIATLIAAFLLVIANSPTIVFLVIPIAYLLILGFVIFKLKNCSVAISLLLSVIYAVIFYYEVIDGID
jgi:hypothetical protein